MCITPAAMAGGGEKGKETTSRSSDEAIPLIDPASFPQRPKPLLELGNPYLGSGTLGPGFRLPTGAVWQPQLLLYGTFQTVVQSAQLPVSNPAPGMDDSATNSEWANRLDFFANLQLSGTERLLVGFRPLDEQGTFSGYRWEDPTTPGTPCDDTSGVAPCEGWVNGFDSEIITVFFEGDFGEIFPNLDKSDTGSLDWGFAVGRQPLSFQSGMLINDELDSVGVIRNTLMPASGSDFQVTAIYGWNDLHRDNNLEDDDGQLFGVFTQGDFPWGTINADAVYVFGTDDDNDGLHWGISNVRRIGHMNTTFRVLGSHALDEETSTVNDGYLLFTELSRTPAWTHDLMYANAFWAIDDFTSAARGAATGGPLGRTGILFAATGLGNFGPALSNRASEAAGGALGYQKFSANTRRQWIFELGGRVSTDSEEDDVDAVAVGVNISQAFGQHFVLTGTVFGLGQESQPPGWGGRVAMAVFF
jgi:hypothetical protein